MITEELIKYVLKDTEYKGYDFQYRPTKTGGWLVWATFYAPDCHSGANEKQTTRKYYVSSFATESELVQTLFLLVKIAEEHEIRENFKYRGGRVFHPHYNIHDLVSLSVKSKEVRL